jgi:hypothetical protein
MSLVDDLKKVKGRIKKGWIQGSLAESDESDGYRDEVDPKDKDAAGWCFIGAIQKEVGSEVKGRGLKVVRAVSNMIKLDPEFSERAGVEDVDKYLDDQHRVGTIISFNDDDFTSEQDVIKLLNKAIKKHTKKSVKPNVKDVSLTSADNIKLSVKKGSVTGSFVLNLKDYPHIKCTSWKGIKPQEITTNEKGIIQIRTNAGLFASRYQEASRGNECSC